MNNPGFRMNPFHHYLSHDFSQISQQIITLIPSLIRPTKCRDTLALTNRAHTYLYMYCYSVDMGNICSIPLRTFYTLSLLHRIVIDWIDNEKEIEEVKQTKKMKWTRLYGVCIFVIRKYIGIIAGDKIKQCP